MFSWTPNLRIFFGKFSCFLLKQGRIFLLRSKILLKLFIFTKKKLWSSFKIHICTRHFSWKKSWIRRFRICENMSQVTWSLCSLWHNALIWKLKRFVTNFEKHNLGKSMKNSWNEKSVSVSLVFRIFFSFVTTCIFFLPKKRDIKVQIDKDYKSPFGV